MNVPLVRFSKHPCNDICDFRCNAGYIKRQETLTVLLLLFLFIVKQILKPKLTQFSIVRESRAQEYPKMMQSSKGTGKHINEFCLHFFQNQTDWRMRHTRQGI